VVEGWSTLMAPLYRRIRRLPNAPDVGTGKAGTAGQFRRCLRHPVTTMVTIPRLNTVAVSRSRPVRAASLTTSQCTGYRLTGLTAATRIPYVPYDVLAYAKQQATWPLPTDRQVGGPRPVASSNSTCSSGGHSSQCARTASYNNEIYAYNTLLCRDLYKNDNSTVA